MCRVKVVLAGGSGALGVPLASALVRAGHEPVILTRSVRRSIPFRQVLWDGRTVDDWAQELAGSVVVNLAGELVDRRPTSSGVDLLMRSRVEPTRALVSASKTVSEAPLLWVQLSTLAIYGDARDVVLTEESPPASGPPQMAGVARAWEEAVAGARTDRLLILRPGVVLDRGTPAIRRLTSLARWGLGGRIGDGRQWISWIHGDDFRAAVLWLFEQTDVEGIVHVTSPVPVRNREFMASIRRAVHRPPAPPTPAPLVRVGARLLSTDPALALTGRRGIPARLLAEGFGFRYPDLDSALPSVVHRT
jgi:uncharacterized protein